MFSNVVEVQTDATAHAHFKYEWYMGGERKLSQLRKELRTRFRNSSLLTANSKYSLFEVRTNCNIEIAGYTDYTLQTGSKFALKTNDGHKFYAQAITNEYISNQLNQTKKLVTNVSKEQQKLMNNVSKEQKKLMNNVSAQSRKQEAARRQEIKSLNTEMKNEMAWLTQSHREQIKKMEQIKEDTISKCQEMNISTHANSINLMYNTIQTHKISFDERTESLKELNVKYQKYYTKLKTEYDRLQQFHHEEIKDPNIKQLVLLGITGDGKSTFGNRLCGDTSKKGKSAPFKASNSATSETTRIKKQIVDTDVARVAVVDTPGIFDSSGDDRFHTNDLIEFLRGCGGVNAFILVKTRFPPRFEDTYKNVLQNLEALFGRDFWKYVIFVLTHTKGKEAVDKNFQQYTTTFRNRVYEEMSINKSDASLPFIGIDSFENYKKPLRELIEILPNDRFKCDELRSPLQELQLKK
eukprot:467988_1